MVFDPWFAARSMKIPFAPWIWPAFTNSTSKPSKRSQDSRLENQINSYTFIKTKVQKGKAYALSFIKEDLHRSGWCSHASIFLASDFTPQFGRVTVSLIVCFFSLLSMCSTLIYKLKVMEMWMYLRIRMNLDPYFVGLTLSSNTFRKFFSKNRTSRSTRVDCSCRVLSTRVGKPPGTLILLVNLVLVTLT